MSDKGIELLGRFEIKCAYDLEKGKDRLLVCLDDPNEEYKQFIFIDEIVIGETKYIAPRK
jgi:hypothetical protein